MHQVWHWSERRGTLPGRNLIDIIVVALKERVKPGLVSVFW